MILLVLAVMEYLFVAMQHHGSSPSFLACTLGAASLALLQGINAVESRFGVRLTVRQIFEELPTLRRVAEHVARLAPAAPPLPVETLTPGPCSENNFV